jgi:5-hydroxyisourate hydrolase-like protein (transthyretin family)
MAGGGEVGFYDLILVRFRVTDPAALSLLPSYGYLTYQGSRSITKLS